MVSPRIRITVVAVYLCITAAASQRLQAAEPSNQPPKPIDYTIQLDTIISGFDAKTCWVAPRAAAIPPASPGGDPTVVVTMQKLLLAGSDVFYGVNDLRSDDGGKTWTPPTPHDSLLRRTGADGLEIVMGDAYPKWHAKTGRILATGTSVRYKKNAAGIDVKVSQNESPARTAYAVYDAAARSWSAWDMMTMPDDPKFFYATVGASQRVDLPNGDILLPFHFKTAGESPYHTAVMRCRFDGTKLTYVEHGTELARPAEPGVEYKQPAGRQTGVFEPSLVSWRGKYYLTMRNDRAAYYAVSDDGLHFGPVQRWRFDDGSDLGSRNTQQHWVTHRDALLLVYTRVGANNDHVFRNRAPLFIAQVDPSKMRVVRTTERILIPERGAGLGNAFGVTEINDHETWVTTAEWMQGPKGILMPGNPYGSDNSVFAARIRWKTPQ